MRRKCSIHGLYNYWEQLAPEDLHAYRLFCVHCKKFSRWGTEAQLRREAASGGVWRVTTYKRPPRLPIDEAI
jgi:hypothetical protein